MQDVSSVSVAKAVLRRAAKTKCHLLVDPASGSCHMHKAVSVNWGSFNPVSGLLGWY